MDPALDERSLVDLATDIGRRWAARGARVASAESCTGGLVARLLTETGGSSAWFDRGVVTYSNEAKVELLGVSPATLGAHGAVSEAVAAEMASGLLGRSAAAAVVSVTGIAGPTGAVPGKPVGTVCFGLAVRGAPVRTERHVFAGDRAAVRAAAARRALELLAAALALPGLPGLPGDGTLTDGLPAGSRHEPPLSAS